MKWYHQQERHKIFFYSHIHTDGEYATLTVHEKRHEDRKKGGKEMVAAV